MKKYRAVFELPARISVTMVISADNQQDGLAAAYDEVLTQARLQPKVEEVFVAEATNILFEAISEADAVAATPVSEPLPTRLPRSLGKFYTVKYFAGDPSGPALAECFAADFASAYAAVQLVLEQGSSFGCATAHDEHGAQTHLARALRGDWEVQGYSAENELIFEQTWLPSLASAKPVVRQLLGNPGVSRITVLDYTNRERGPVIVREIK
jgi:hypothetical protein